MYFAITFKYFLSQKSISQILQAIQKTFKFENYLIAKRASCFILKNTYNENLTTIKKIFQKVINFLL